ncbi:glycosyltransferase [Hymenobacter caeli]|uniref:Glycosyltransferase involved in cell wall biosynthesis n=1 Tax=Hymenobacter caeli TaxID=2735894 RepID=A0ABX2FNE0_9BACT|nr:glycosyltransferase [Hymenobacter caeli]NRT18690.1 glycosyltransferase involved in cell wall biosynthesis [Hymenobacter caeli]
MNILHITADMDPRGGGVCQAVRTMIAGLTARGVASEVASLDDPTAPYVAAEAFPLHALGPGRRGWAYSARLGPWLDAHLARFDAVIVHGLWLYPSYAARRARQRQGAGAPPLFVMPHGMLDPYFQRAPGRRLKAVRNWVYWKLMEGAVVNDAAGVLFTCEEERRLAREPFRPYRPKRELVVGLGVEEPPVFVPAMRAAFAERMPNAQAQPYLLFLSRLHEKKGADMLVQAYAGGAAGAPAPHLVVAGPGLDTPYGQRVRALAAGAPAGTVAFPGMVAGASKWGAFYGAAAFVLPSHQENFGIAVVEALACGKPVLISNQINIWREIEAAGAGLVADATPAGTHGLLTRWSALTPAEQHAMGQRARAAFEHYFATGPATDRLLAALIAT